MNKRVVSEKGQVTIPKEVRERLGIRAGTVLEFREERGKLIGTKATGDDPVDEAFGILDMGRSTDQQVDRLRGPAE